MPAPPSQRANHRFSRRVANGVLLAAVLTLAPHTPAGAQTPQPVSLRLVAHPVWHAPEDLLRFRLKVTNHGPSTLAGFHLQVRAYSPASSRSELHENFSVDPLRIESSSLRVERPELEVAAGGSTVVDIDSPVSGLTSLADSGVYPITITLTDADGFTALDSLTTQLLYFSEDVEVPLNLVLVWPMTDLPSRRAGGTFETALIDESVTLEEAISASGWLTGVLDALEAPFAEPFRAGIAPGPRMVEELADMADGFRRNDGDSVTSVVRSNPAAKAAGDALGRFRDLVAGPRIQSVHMPYAFPDLTAIDDFEQMSGQLTAAQAVLDEHLGIAPAGGWLFPPAGRVDEITLERLHSSDHASNTFFSTSSIETDSIDPPATCLQDFLGTPYTCPVRVATATGESHGFVLDPELQQRFSALVASPSDTVEMQKLFAEITMIWAELPGTGDRVIPLAVPPLWHPPPGVAARFIRTMSRGPWVRMRTPRAGLDLGIGAIARELVTDAQPLRAQPDPGYLDEIDGAAAIVESFARIRPPIDLLQRLRRDVLVGRSLLWWSDDPSRLAVGAEFSTDTRLEAESELSKISIVGNTEITLASRRGSLPLSLQNSANYPVTVEVHLHSTDRDLELSQREVAQTFEPGTTPLAVQISARSSGGYPVTVRVTASDGFEIFERYITIRSTEFNEIALGITLGALAFLVLFTTVRGIRRRRGVSPGSESTD